MIKLIKLNNNYNEGVLMSFEEVLENCKGLMIEKAKKYGHISEVYGEYDFEDLLQEAQVGLYEAYVSYDETKNYKFTTLATRCIENRYKLIIRDKNRLKREGEAMEKISLDEQRNDGEHQGAENYERLLLADNDFEESFISSILMEEINSELTEREKIYLLILIKEIKAVNVAKELGISKAAISKGLTKTKRKLKFLLEERLLNY